MTNKTTESQGKNANRGQFQQTAAAKSGDLAMVSPG
jgi:hypothetical protein